MEWLAFGLFCALFSGLFGGSLFVPEITLHHDPFLLLIGCIINGFVAILSLRKYLRIA